MNSTEVQCFLASAETLSFSRAAEQLFLTRQAVSRKILQLEEELGTRLFDRSGQGLTLTAQGEACFAFFKTTMVKWDQLQSCLAGGRETALQVASPEGILLPTAVQDALFTAGDQFQTEICIHAYDVHDLPQLAADEEYPVIFTYGNPALSAFQAYRQVPVGTLGMVLASSRRLLPQAQDPAAFADYPVSTWLRRNQTPEDARNRCVESCRRFGFPCRQVRVFPNRATARTEIEAGRCVGVCTELDRFTFSPSIRTLPLAGTSTLVCLCQKDSQTPLTRSILRSLAG